MTGFKRTTRGRNRKKRDFDILGLVLIITSSFLLICNIAPVVLGVVGFGIRSVLLGLFGVFSYVLLASLILLGFKLFFKKKLYVKKRYFVIGTVLLLLVVTLIQIAIDFWLFGEVSYLEYLRTVYDAEISAGGLVFGVIAYGLASSMSPIIAILAISIILAGFLGFVLFKSIISRGDFSFMKGEVEKEEKPSIKKVSDRKSAREREEDSEDEEYELPASVTLKPTVNAPVSGLFVERIYSKSAEKNSYLKESSKRNLAENTKTMNFDASPKDYIADFRPNATATKSLNSKAVIESETEDKYAPFGAFGEAPKPSITMHDSFNNKGIVVPSPKVQSSDTPARKIYSSVNFSTAAPSIRPNTSSHDFTDYIPDPVREPKEPEKQAQPAPEKTTQTGRKIYTSSGEVKGTIKPQPQSAVQPTSPVQPAPRQEAPAPQKPIQSSSSSFSDYLNMSRQQDRPAPKPIISEPKPIAPAQPAKTDSFVSQFSRQVEEEKKEPTVEEPKEKESAPESVKITNFEEPMAEEKSPVVSSPFSYNLQENKVEDIIANPFTKTVDEKESAEDESEIIADETEALETESEEDIFFNSFADKQFGSNASTPSESEKVESEDEDEEELGDEYEEEYSDEEEPKDTSEEDNAAQALDEQPVEQEAEEENVSYESFYNEEPKEESESSGLVIEDNEPIDLSESTPPVSAEEDNTGVYTRSFTPEPAPAPIPAPIPAPTKRKRGEPDPNQLQFEDLYENQIRFNEMVPSEDGPYNYTFPPLDMLDNSDEFSTDDEEVTKNRIQILEQKLAELDFPAKVVNVVYGPAVVRFEVAPPPGKKIGGLRSLAEDIEIALCGGRIRMEIPVEGKPVAGIEVRKAKASIVRLKDMFLSEKFTHSKLPIPIAFGVDLDGNKYIESLKSMPHLLVAGTTQSGKSVFLNTVLLSIIYKHSPEDVKLLLIDPKQVELTPYEGIPHMLVENAIFYDIKNNINYPLKAFNWAVEEMERRYSVFNEIHAMNESVNVKSIMEYNDLPEVKSGKYRKMPFIVIVVDEFADLVTNNKNELLGLIARLCAKAAACGIHMIIATQRPSTDVIDGTIKNNLPTRCAFKMSSFTDSNTVLGCAGAESLLGRGDMLLQKDGNLRRMQSPFTQTQTISDIINFVKNNNESKYDKSIQDYIFAQPKEEFNNDVTDENMEDDKDSALLPQIMRMFIKKGSASASMIQTRFSLGYARSTRIIYTLENKNWIGESSGSSKGREVLMTPAQFEEVFKEPYEEIT